MRKQATGAVWLFFSILILAADFLVSVGGFLILLTLKLTEVVDWSWWWITAPLWISAILTSICIGIIIAFICFCVLVCWIIGKSGGRIT